MAMVNHIAPEDASEQANATARHIFTASQDTRLTVLVTADSAGNGSKVSEKKNCEIGNRLYGVCCLFFCSVAF